RHRGQRSVAKAAMRLCDELFAQVSRRQATRLKTWRGVQTTEVAASNHTRLLYPWPAVHGEKSSPAPKSTRFLCRRLAVCRPPTIGPPACRSLRETRAADLRESRRSVR